MNLMAGIALLLLFTPAVVAQPADTLRHTQALQRYRNGQELLRVERFEKAAAEFSAAIERDPLFALAHYGLGQSYMALRRYPPAIHAFVGCREAYRKIIAMRDEQRADTDSLLDDEIRELQSMVTRIRGGQLRGGESKIMRVEARIDALRHMRQDPVTQFRVPGQVSLALGSAYFRNGNHDLGEVEWKVAIDVNPRFGEAHNNLAVVYMMTGRFPLAERAVQAAENAGYRVNPQFKRDLENKKLRQ